MDRVPLITPALVKAVSTKTDNSLRVLTAEVVSSTPVKNRQDESSPNSKHKQNESQSQHSNQNQNQSQSQSQEKRYSVVLQLSQPGSKAAQKITTISTHDLQPGSQIEVKVLPGPELKIINSDKAARSSDNNSRANMAQQLLADRVPNIQQKDIANLVKDLKQQLSQANLATNNQTSITSPTAATTHKNEQVIAGSFAANAGNKLYQILQAQNLNILPESELTNKLSANNHLNQRISNAEILKSIKSWMQNLPQSQDITTSNGLKNALNNAGTLSEPQLRRLAQQSLNLPKITANSIFQQLQKASANISNNSNNDKQTATNLSQLVKNTAKALNKGSQQVLASLTNATANPTANPTLNSTLLTSANWQNPLLNSQQHLSLESLLQDPLLQNPSSNNKIALSQILGLGLQRPVESPVIPLNWPNQGNNDSSLQKTLQNLLGHIEREQLQHLQSSEGNQTNNPAGQTTLQQQWLPLLVIHQQQLQLIEFFIDKEEKETTEGEKKNHWFINLHFDLPILGTIGIEISMFENECSTTFWSESSSTLSQISKHIQPLRERLTEQGIIVSDIQSRHGTLTKRKQNIQQRLVDIST